MSISPDLARIGVRVPPWLAYGREIYQGIGQYMAEHNLHWQVDTSLEADGELRSFSIDEAWQGDGAIFFRYTESEARAFAEAGTPLISASRVSPCDWVPRIHPDNRMVGKIAAEHLIGCGSPNLVCWVDPDRSYSVERLEGFRECAEQYNREVIVIETPISKFPDETKRRKINESILATLKELPLPAAIFCRDDIWACAVLRNAHRLEIKTPEDIIVLGVGDDPILSSVALPKLSSITIPGKQIGWQAAKMLHDRLKAKKPVDTSQPGEVCELPVHETLRRQSTDYLHTSDTLIAKACELIRMASGKEKITVQQICNQLDVSNTTLLQRFQEGIGMPPKQFIDKSRYEEAIRLLNQTTWPIKEISYELGFRSPEEFDRFFKRHSNTTPGKFRNADIA